MGKSYLSLLIFFIAAARIQAKDIPAALADKPASSAATTPKADTAQKINNPAGQGQTAQPPSQTPSGTKPADPANPGENPTEPAEPGDKDKSDKGDKDSKDGKDKKDKKDKPGKGGKSGGGSSLPAVAPSPQAAGAAGAVGGGIIGGILSGGKKSETVKSTASVQASTPAVAAEPLYSEGKGPKIAVIDFEGDYGARFAELLAEALKADLKVYNRKKLAAKKYEAKTVTRVSAKKIAAEAAVDYIVTGKITQKTETLSIISVFLRDGKTGDIKMTDYSKLKSADDLKTTAESASRKIKEKIEELE